MSVNINLPSPESYENWDVWAKAIIRALVSIFAYTQISTDIGMLVSFPNSINAATNIIPHGWLKCDGSTFDKYGYPVLFDVLGTNTLPTLTSPYGAGYTTWIRAA